MLRLKMLGGVALDRDGVPLEGRATQRRRLALLCLLAVNRRGVSRDKLITYLWPDVDCERGRHSLSQTLYALRRELGDEVILAGVDELRLNPAALTADGRVFEEALDQGDSATAVAAYGGPFLDGFHLSDSEGFEEWADGERTRLGSRYARALDDLAAAASTRGDLAGAAEWRRRRTRLDPYDSRAARAWIESLASAGDRAGALRQAEAHADLLRRELGLEPDGPFGELVARLRSGNEPGTEARGEALRSAADREPTTEVAELLRATSDPAAPSAPVIDRAVRSSRTRRFALGAATLGAGAVAVLVGGRIAASHEALAPRAVILGSIRGPNDTLVLAVSTALRAELEASPEIRVVSEGQIEETLRLMVDRPERPLTAGVATAVARRRGVPFVVVGSVTPVGNGAQVIAQLLDDRGSTVVALSERPATRDELLRVVGRMSRDLRRRLLRSPIDSGLKPLPAVTTASFPALESFLAARAAIAKVERPLAVRYLEAALIQDSLFALAHYLAADQLWYLNQQRHAEEHFQRAIELSDRVSPRERLAIKARYEQLVLDRPDSALATWKLLQVTYPGEPLAYDGIAWTYRAMHRWRQAVAAMDTALTLDSEPRSDYLVAMGARILLDLEDRPALERWRRNWSPRSAGVVSDHVERAYLARDWQRLLDSLPPLDVRVPDGDARRERAYYRQNLLLALGRLREAETELGIVATGDYKLTKPRALLLQARAELGMGGRAERAARHAWATLAWLSTADVSAPTFARNLERLADVAARLQDEVLLDSVAAMVQRLDGGRGLASYHSALASIAAARAFARQDWARAASLAAEAEQGNYFGRSNATVTLLEADARAAAGQREVADSLYRWVRDHGPATGDRSVDGDTETWMVLSAVAARAIRSGGRQ